MGYKRRAYFRLEEIEIWQQITQNQTNTLRVNETPPFVGIDYEKEF